MIWFLIITAYVLFHLEYFYKFFTRAKKSAESGRISNVLTLFFAAMWLVPAMYYSAAHGSIIAMLFIAAFLIFFAIGYLQGPKGETR